MYRTISVVLLLAFLATPVIAETPTESEFSFAVPATANGETVIDHDGIVYLYFPEGAPGQVRLELAATVTLHQHDATFLDSEGLVGSWYLVPGSGSSTEHPLQGPGSMTLVFGEQAGTLLIRAADLELYAGEGQLRFTILEPGRCAPGSGFGPQTQIELTRTHYCADVATPLVVLSPHSVLTIRAAQLHQVEWLGADITCHDVSGCPAMAEPDSPGATTNLQSTQIRTLSWYSLEAGAETLHAVGSTPRAVLVGDTDEVSLQGSLRLPQASFKACEECTDGRQTVQLKGELKLSGLQAGPDNRLTGAIQHHEANARIDEHPVDANLLLGTAPLVATSMALTALLAALAKFLLPLTTRLTSEEALRHPRRQHLMAFIEECPGATFREILRETGIPAGTARHHLTVMRRSGLILEKRHRSTLRFFENHGKYEENWDLVVLLREEPLAMLHAWLMENPSCKQTVILDAMKSMLGWSRSTTQHRLERLVDGGLVTVRPQGRLKLYTAHEEIQKDPSSQLRDWADPHPLYA